MKLKISKKMSTLLMPTEVDGTLVSAVAGCASIQDLIRAQWATGGIAKDGSMFIVVNDMEVGVLAAHALSVIPELEAALEAATTDEEKRPFFGLHSSWSALLRNIEREGAKAEA